MITLLSKNVQPYRELIDNANVIVNAFDSSGNILIWNKAAEEISGYSAKEAIGNKKIMEFLYPDARYRKEVLKCVGTAFKNNYKNIEFILMTKYGEKKCISWSAIAVRNKKGKVVGSFAVGIDVTIKNLIKERERQSFRALLKAVRYHEDIKQQYEKLIQSLKEEIDSLLKELSRPPKY